MNFEIIKVIYALESFQYNRSQKILQTIPNETLADVGPGLLVDRKIHKSYLEPA